jgi:hypothetical protein
MIPMDGGYFFWRDSQLRCAILRSFDNPTAWRTHLAQCHLSFVGANPRSAADALACFLGVIDLRTSRTGGSGADQGIRPTIER